MPELTKALDYYEQGAGHRLTKEIPTRELFNLAHVLWIEGGGRMKSIRFGLWASRSLSSSC